MDRIRTLRTTLLVQFWTSLIFGGLGTIGILAAVMIPNLLAARDRAAQLGGDASGGGSLAGVYVALLLILLLLAALIILPLWIRRRLDQGQNMTGWLWTNAMLQITNLPVGTVLAILQIVALTDAEATEAIRIGRARAVDV